MTIQAFQTVLRQMPSLGNHPSTALVKRFLKLMDGESPLQVYLENMLPSLVELFSASAGLVWLRAQGSQGACFAIRYHMDKIDWGDRGEQKHDRLVQLAWQQRQSMLVEPRSKVSNSLRNSTAHPILFGPIVHIKEPIALMELVLPRFEAPISESQRAAYLRGMQMVMEYVHTGLQARFRLPAASIAQAEVQVRQLEEEIQSYHLSIQRSIETRLRTFHGWTFGSLEDNQKFAKMVHRILDEHGLRVICPECGHAAILRCLGSGNSKNGVFVFDHYLEGGRTFHGGPSTFPSITVGPKPARRIGLSAS